MSASTPPLLEGKFGPLVHGGRHRTGGWDWRRLGLMAGGTLGALLVVVGTSAVVAVIYGVNAIDRVDVTDLVGGDDVVTQADDPDEIDGDTDGDGTPDIEELADVLNVLVVGSDSREGLTEQQLLELGTEEDPGLRTDTIMLLQLDPRREQVSLISFPRDLLVTRCDGSRGRINAAFAIGEDSGVGGGSCIVRTVTDFTGIPINHFVQVNLVGFVDIVDALGGVSIFLDEPIRDVFAGADFDAGCVTMNGIEALSFVRVRRIDSDFGRIARQQRFIREVVRESTSVGTLVNPARLFSLVDAGARAVETDRELSIRQMRRIGFSLRDLGPEQLDTRTVPTTSRRINGAAIEVADEQAADALFAAFRDGTLVPDEVGRDAPRVIGIDDVPAVIILNGVGQVGLAAQATTQLEALGVAVAEAANADSFEFELTQVVHAPDQLEEAELLAEAIGGAMLVPGDDDERLTVVLGADYEPQDIDPDTIGPGEDVDDADDADDVDDVDDAVLADDPTATPAPDPAETPQFAGADAEGSC